MRKSKRLKTKVEQLTTADQSTTADIESHPKIIVSKSAINHNDDSSGDSDLDQYLHKADKIDLNSSFFTNISPEKNENLTSSSKIDNPSFGVTSRLSDSPDSTSEDEPLVKRTKNAKSSQKNVQTNLTQILPANFKAVDICKKQIEEARKVAEQYVIKKEAEKKAAKKIEDAKIDILNLLTLGEGGAPKSDTAISLNSSDFESYDSEAEDWEEVKTKEEPKEKSIIPIGGVEVVVEMPSSVKNKKKKYDFLAAMKRRLNRIRKENQLYVHKVHLLCWIAHGNFVNDTINNSKILASALSLMPSEKSYPSNRIDLSYLEQFLQWYKKTLQISENENSDPEPLEKSLESQIRNKQVENQKMLVYIFIAILRALGVHCRLVLSFVVEPLRPPSSDLHSLSTKEIKPKKSENKNNISESKKKSDSNSAKRKNLDESKNKTSKFLKSENNSSTNKLNKKNLERPLKKVKEETELRKEKTISKEEGTNSKKEEKKKISLKKLSGKDITKQDLSSENGKRTSKNSKESSVKTEEKKLNFKVKIVSKKPQKIEKLKINLNRLTGSKSTEKSVNTKKSTSNTLLQPKESRNTRSKSSNNNNDSSKDKDEKVSLRKKLSIGDTNVKNKPLNEKVKSGQSRRKSKSPVILQTDGALDDYSSCETSDDDKKSSTSSIPSTSKHLSRSTQSKNKTQTKNNSEDEFRSQSPIKDSLKVNLQRLRYRDKTKSVTLDVRNDVAKLVKKNMKQLDQSKRIKRKSIYENDSSDDSDYLPEAPKKRVIESDSAIKKTSKQAKNRKVLSSDSESNSPTKSKSRRKRIDVWAEVFVEAEEKWICVDVVHGALHCVNELYARATSPVAYIVAWNNDNSLKDVTIRYCQNFNTVTRKLRIDNEWWKETLKPFLGKSTARDQEEDDEFARQQLEKPLPTSIAEFKNHPLYVLSRHLLKFEAIYPPNAPTLGFVRGEPVYSRKCVYTLHSRDIWLKHAKVVRMGEKPYKIVKARPKYDKLSNSVITDQLLEIFGPWQVEDYVPPTAENGKVPRNAFGNVELFKPCMLPKKCVHLQLPGLNKIARRMNIDCASAIVGFDFHGGWSHPTYDGFVVCEEFEDSLVLAWNIEQEEIAQKELVKIETRVYGNWKKLIKGLLIRERLKNRYDFGTEKGDGKVKKNVKGSKLILQKRRLCSDDESN